jgi:hypothetical protein
MKIAVQYTIEDYYAANRLHYARSKVKYVILALGFLFCVIGVSFLSFGDGTTIAMGTFELLVGLYLLTYAYIPLWIRTQYAFRRAPNFRAPHSFEINETELKRETQERGSGILYWKSFVRSEHNNKVLLLYISDRQFIVLPRRFVSDGEWQRTLAIVRSQVPQGRKDARPVLGSAHVG